MTKKIVKKKMRVTRHNTPGNKFYKKVFTITGKASIINPGDASCFEYKLKSANLAKIMLYICSIFKGISDASVDFIGRRGSYLAVITNGNQHRYILSEQDVVSFLNDSVRREELIQEAKILLGGNESQIIKEFEDTGEDRTVYEEI